jgi:acylphosphatase
VGEQIEAMGNQHRRGFLVSGRVQGVGFRWWTRKRALDLGLKGMVRNLPDGRVRVDAEGPPDSLQRLYEALRQGPPTAQVDQVETVDPVSGPYPSEFDTY